MKIDLVDSDWHKVFAVAVAEREREVCVVCPFIKRLSVRRLFRSDYHPKIRVITRFNLADFCAGVSDVASLRFLVENGAEIRGVKGLHAKLYLFGENRAIVTSANLTEAALLRNHEFGFISTDPTITIRCRSYFETLWALAGENLTENQLYMWEEKLTRAVLGGLRPSNDAGLSDEGTDVERRGSGSDALPSTIAPLFSDVEQAFVKFLGEGDNREDLDCRTIDEVGRAGCHWACAYPKGKRPRSVRDGDIMLFGRLVENDTRVFGRAVAIAHTEGRDDATPADIAARNWKDHWCHYARVHHAEFVAGTLANGISLAAMMDTLKSDSFGSTQENATRGIGNIDPRGAYRQQAAVRLSREGYEWLNTRLERAFQLHGTLTPEEMDALDWPDVPTIET